MEKKEKRNIYNATFNKKKATSIQTDLEAIENAIFEWENNENIRFRVVADTKKSDKSPCDNCTATQTLTNQGTYATSIANRIITFYSDRNFKEKMTFKNPKVTEYYAKRKRK